MTVFIVLEDLVDPEGLAVLENLDGGTWYFTERGNFSIDTLYGKRKILGIYPLRKEEKEQ